MLLEDHQMGVDWTHAASSALAVFLASLVEFVEALTVVLAVGAVRGWRGALAGSSLALTVLLALVALLGPALTRIPLCLVQVAVGLLLLLFGLRWLRKAILRAAGIIALHDEAAAYARETAALKGLGVRTLPWDGVAIAASFKIVMLEGVEVVFIVVAVGAGGGLLAPAAVGALAALAVVVMLGLLLHRPVASIPENALKFVVGVLLSAFGTFWVGEGIGAVWPGQDWSLPGLAFAYGLLAVGCVRLARFAALHASGPQIRRTAA
jgi:Ca2+/H+ antiporter, TMEM165/GDT1 family